MSRLLNLTPASLTLALQGSGVLQKSSVIDFETERIGEELGFNGILYRCHLAYDIPESQAPATLIAKFPQDRSKSGTVESESRFYQEFHASVGIRIPRSYVADAENLLLEDLAPLKCGDVAAGCSGDEARLIVRHLAGFHAAGWQQPKITRNDRLPHWPTDPDRYYHRLREFHPAFLDRFGSLISESMQLLTLRLIEKIPHVVERLRQAPVTLIHVDTHLDNIFFELPDTVVLIDWQSASFGPAVIDLSRFLGMSLSADVRRSVERETLSEYFQILKVRGIDDYTQADLHDHLKLAFLRWWAGMVTGFGAANPEQCGDRQTALQQIEIERMSDVVSDWQLSRFLEQIG